MSASQPVPLEVLLAHRPFVTALARALVRDPAAAEDLEQEAWVAAIESPPGKGGSVRGWFARVLRNAARDAWRTSRRRERREALGARTDPDPSAADVAARAEIHRRVVLAVFALDEPSRRTVLLRFFEGLPTSEIAAREGVPQATVRKRLERALAQLRERLDEEDGGDRRRWLAALVPLAGGEEAAAGDEVPSARAATVAPRRARWVAAAVAAAVVAVVTVGLVTGGRFGAPTPDEGDDGASDASAASSRESPDPAARAKSSVVADAAPAAASPAPAAAGAADAPGADADILVVSPEDEPVPDATVRAFRLAPRGTYHYVVTSEWPDPNPLQVTATVRTDGAGRASLRGLPSGGYLVVAEGAGYAASGPADVWIGAKRTKRRLLLRRAADLTGRVVDEATGGPADAEVVAVDSEDHIAGADFPRPTVRTAPDGTFRIDGLPAGVVHVAARRPGGLYGSGTYVDLEGLPRVTLRLAAVAPVGGKAVDARTRAPVPGAALLAEVRSISGGLGIHARVVTGPDGRFELPGAPLGAMVRFVPAPGGPWRPDWTRPGIPPNDAMCQSVPPDGFDDLVVALLRPGSVAGRVTCADGTPGAGAEVLVLGDTITFGSISVGTNVTRTTADADGNFRVDGLAPGRFEVFARRGNEHSGRPTDGTDLLLRQRPGSPDDGRLEVPAGGVAVRDLHLAPGLEVSGRVLLPDGSPAAGARVLTANRHIGSRWAVETETDADGRFVLRAVPPGSEPLVVHARAEDARGEATVDGARREVTIRLDASPVGATVSGRVVGPDGAPVPGVRLAWFQREDDEDETLARFHRHGISGDGRAIPVRRDGTFDLEIHDARWQKSIALVASARGLLPGAARAAIRPGGRTTDVTVSLSGGTEILGRLRNADGTPAAGVPVRAVPAPRGGRAYGGVAPALATDQEGRFRLVVADGESVALYFGDMGREVLRLPSAPPGREFVEAVLPAETKPRDSGPTSSGGRAAPDPFPERPAHRLEGRVSDADGRPVEGAEVRYTTTGARGRRTTGGRTDTEGQFALAVHEDASGTLEVDAGLRGTAIRDGVSGGAASVQICVVPRPDPVVRGFVRDETGGPVPGAVVTCIQSPEGAVLRQSVNLDEDRIRGRDGWECRTLAADDAGAFRVPSLPSGRWTLWAGAPGTPWSAAALLVVDAKDTTEADLRVRRGRVLRARIVAEDGRTRRGTRVRIFSRPPRCDPFGECTVTAAADGDGFLEVPGLPPGPWLVTIVGAGSAEAVEVPESADAVEIRF